MYKWVVALVVPGIVAFLSCASLGIGASVYCYWKWPHSELSTFVYYLVTYVYLYLLYNLLCIVYSTVGRSVADITDLRRHIY